MLHTQAQDIINNLNDGFSFWFDGTVKTTGYSVGNGAKGIQTVHNPAAPIFACYLVALAARFEAAGFHGIGGWIDEGILYIDPIHHVVDRDTALFLGRQQNELAIFDIAATDCIETGLRNAFASDASA